MRKNYFPLGVTEDNRFIKILRLLFGAACIGLAVWWINFNIRSNMTIWSLWLAIPFMAGFGLYQVWAGLGRTTRFIVIDRDYILIKKNSILSPVNIKAAETAKIDIYPLSVVFSAGSGKKFLLRFGTVNYETNEKIVDEIVRFAEENNIQYQVREEEIKP